MVMTFPPDAALGRKDVEKMVSRSPLALQFFLGEEPRVEVELEGKVNRERLRSAKKVLMSLV